MEHVEEKKRVASKKKELPFDGVRVKGAREHNLKNIDLDIPRNKITVMTGLSGSGKSSLAFDTVYAEGQRRYVESLSAYARNFLEQLKRPAVDSIWGLSPAIAIEQKTTTTSPRSTVGTVTEIYDFLRLLFAKAGTPVCPKHNIPLDRQTPSEIVKELAKLPEGTKLTIFSPVVQAKKGEFAKEFDLWLRKGFVRARIDGKLIELESATKLAKTKSHNIDVVIDRIITKPGAQNRISEAVHSAIQLSNGYVTIENLNTKKEVTHSIHQSCPKCGYSFPELEPRLFSFNNPKGACENCRGLGFVGPELDDSFEGEDEDSSRNRSPMQKARARSAAAEEDSVESAVATDERSLEVCSTCKGYRLKAEPLHVLIGGRHIGQYGEMKISTFQEELKTLKLAAALTTVTEKILKELQARSQYLVNLGVGYLSLSRSSRTLSGGESQRIKLASQLGSALVGVLYVLDEPSIGLHPRDHNQLLKTIRALRDMGNTIIIVEHDEDTMRMADFVVDIGPRAGRFGGAIMAQGTPLEVEQNKNSLTGDYLSGRKLVNDHSFKRRVPADFIKIVGASGNNLKAVNVEIPLGVLACVTGVSGGGKSTLIIDTLYKHLANHFYNSGWTPAPFKKIDGADKIENIINIDQKPIGRTPRSNPATYVGLFSQIRDLFSQLPESRLRGYAPGRFSFNVKNGRCEACEGAGNLKVEMHFMADVYVPCDVCQGRRYNRETLSVKYRDKSIADVLEMSVGEANDFFEHHKIIHKRVETLHRVGLDYITLGQSSTTLSGGEAQRVKLSRELSKRGQKTLYILDEPTTGLHFEDIKKLIELLHRLVDQGNSVVVIEHNLDVVQASDYVIDLGPEGGDGGGQIVAIGKPEEIAKVSGSHTGKYLAEHIKRHQRSAAVVRPV